MSHRSTKSQSLICSMHSLRFYHLLSYLLRFWCVKRLIFASANVISTFAKSQMWVMTIMRMKLCQIWIMSNWLAMIVTVAFSTITVVIAIMGNLACARCKVVLMMGMVVHVHLTLWIIRISLTSDWMVMHKLYRIIMV
jgi:hypothetical protein